MATITIRLSESDKELFTNVSKEKNKTLSDWARESLLEKIEQEYDEKIVNEYLLNKDNMKFYSDDEVKKSWVYESCLFRKIIKILKKT